MPGSTGLLGIAMTGPDLYAVSGSIHGGFKIDNMQVYIMSLLRDSESGILVDSISVPKIHGLNSMESSPEIPRVVLSAGSYGSCIWRINTLTRKTDVAVTDPLLGHGPTYAD